MFDLKTSKRLGEKFAELGMVACFSYVSRAIEALNELGNKAFYVEGWLVTPDCEDLSDTDRGVYTNRGWKIWREGDYSVIEHCWVEIDDRIIDPTLYDVFLDQPFFYFPGVYYSKVEISNAKIVTQKITRDRRPIKDLNSKSAHAYGSAFRQARQKMYELSEQKQTSQKQTTKVSKTREERINELAQKIIEEFEAKKTNKKQ
jgi:hypothetical protein